MIKCLDFGVTQTQVLLPALPPTYHVTLNKFLCFSELYFLDLCCGDNNGTHLSREIKTIQCFTQFLSHCTCSVHGSCYHHHHHHHKVIATFWEAVRSCLSWLLSVWRTLMTLSFDPALDVPCSSVLDLPLFPGWFPVTHLAWPTTQYSYLMI